VVSKCVWVGYAYCYFYGRMSGKEQIKLYRYNSEECVYKEHVSLKDCAELGRNSHVNWIIITGAKQKEDIKEAAEIFQLHPLVVEDIIHTEQRAKVEDYGDSFFIVMRMFALINGKIEDQQISFVLKDNMLITFTEEDYGIFKTQLGDKLVAGTTRARGKGEDYLLYRLLDIIIDNYYFVLQHIDHKLEILDAEILHKASDSHILIMQKLKSELLYMRKSFLPARELITTLERNNVEYFDVDNKYYLRDLDDHMLRNIEELDFQREQINSLMDFFYSLQTHKMNNVMKTLTIVSFIFLPLTFVASLYGMNFTVIPRANDPLGFWEVLGGMGILAFFLVIYAVRRKWLSSRDFSKSRL